MAMGLRIADANSCHKSDLAKRAVKRACVRLSYLRLVTRRGIHGKLNRQEQDKGPNGLHERLAKGLTESIQHGDDLASSSSHPVLP